MISYISNFLEFCLEIFNTFSSIIGFIFGESIAYLAITCILFIVVLAIIRGVRN